MREGWAMAPAWVIRSPVIDVDSCLTLLTAGLFAPYCGGVNRESDLADALRLFLGGHLHGCRPIQGTDGHPLFSAGWSSRTIGIAALPTSFSRSPGGGSTLN